MPSASPQTLVILLLLLVPATGSRAAGDGGGLPPVISKALDAYAQKGLDALIPALVRGGPLEGQERALEQTRTLRRIEAFYGAYQDHELLLARDLGRRNRLVYFILNYEKGAVFGKALLHGQGAAASVTSFNFHTAPEKILPPSLLGGRLPGH